MLLEGSLTLDGHGWLATFMLLVPGWELMISLRFNLLTSMVLGALLLGEETTVRFVNRFLIVVGAVVLASLSSINYPQFSEQTW